MTKRIRIRHAINSKGKLSRLPSEEQAQFTSHQVKAVSSHNYPDHDSRFQLSELERQVVWTTGDSMTEWRKLRGIV